MPIIRNINKYEKHFVLVVVTFNKSPHFKIFLQNKPNLHVNLIFSFYDNWQMKTKILIRKHFELFMTFCFSYFILISNFFHTEAIIFPTIWHMRTENHQHLIRCHVFCCCWFCLFNSNIFCWLMKNTVVIIPWYVQYKYIKEPSQRQTTTSAK